jgi:hypothetical protein
MDTRLKRYPAIPEELLAIATPMSIARTEERRPNSAQICAHVLAITGSMSRLRGTLR